MLMLLPPKVPFGTDWTRAARTVADVVTLAPVRRSRWPTVDGTSFLSCDPSTGVDYEVRELRARPDRLFRPLVDRVMLRRLLASVAAIEADHGPLDVAHSHFYPNARALPAVRRLVGLPYVHTEHSTRLTGASPHPRKRLTPAAARAAAAVFSDASHVVMVSEYLRSRLVDQGFPGSFEVIGNPFDVDLFHPAEQRRSDDGAVRAVSVGRLENDKGLDVVLHAFAIALGGDPRLRLEVIGDGPLRAELVHLAGALGISERVRFAGRLPREDIAAALQGSDLYVTGTRIETFGVAVAEAMACGLPVAACGAGSLPELIPSGAGIVVGVDDAAALARAILELARGRHDPKAIARPISERFSYAAVGRRLLPLYQDARAHRARPAVARSRR